MFRLLDKPSESTAVADIYSDTSEDGKLQIPQEKDDYKTFNLKGKYLIALK